MPAAGDRGLRRSVDALHYSPFARFWVGSLVSNCGSWIQNISVPYVIYRSSGSAALVGVVGVCQFLPVFVVGPVGGWVADRHPRRTVLVLANAFQGVLAVVLWAAYGSGHRSTGLLLVLVLLTSAAQAFSLPALQAYLTELVPRTALLSAVTLNSAQFTASRAVGPAIGGVILAELGPTWAFGINGASYVVVVAMLLSIRGGPAPRSFPRQTLLAQTKASLRYVAATRGTRVAILVLALVGGLGQPLLQLLAVFADEVLRVDARAYGLMVASLGTGGVLGAVTLGSLGRRSRAAVVRRATVAYGVLLLLFAVTPSAGTGIPTLLGAGFFYLMVTATLNTTVQLQVPDRLRGGVLAVNLMAFHLAYPLGSLVQGALADLIGARATVAVAAAALLSASGLLAAKGSLASLDDEIEEPAEAAARGPLPDPAVPS